MSTYTTEQAHAIGGKPWSKGDKLRVYFDVPALVKLDVDYYGSGNIRSATLDGEKISNAEAQRLVNSKAYLENGEIVVDTPARNGDAIETAVRAALDATVEPTVEPATVVEVEDAPTARRAPIVDTMLSIGTLTKMRAARGGRYLVSAVVRSGRFAAVYCDTAEEAEATRQYMNEKYRQVAVTPPVGSVDLVTLGAERERAKRAFDEATEALRAAVAHAINVEQRTEPEVERDAKVSRQTVRSWAGK